MLSLIHISNRTVKEKQTNKQTTLGGGQKKFISSNIPLDDKKKLSMNQELMAKNLEDAGKAFAINHRVIATGSILRMIHGQQW